MRRRHAASPPKPPDADRRGDARIYAGAIRLSDPRQLLSGIEQAAPGRPLAACQASASPFCQMFWHLLSSAPSPSPLRSLRRPIESAQYLSLKYIERLKDAGVEPSVGSVGDSYDNALAETINGL